MKVLIIADVQGNLTALDAVLAHAASDAAHVIGLGDFACGPEPARVMAVGHLHDPLLRIVDDAWVLNPGSVGWPNVQSDGLRPTSASFAMLEANSGSMHVRFGRVSYSPAQLLGSTYESGMPHADWYLRHWRT